MKKFLVLYFTSARQVEEWMNTDPEFRRVEEEKVMKEWQAWVNEHREMLSSGTAGVGKTKHITAEGIADTRNDIMMFSIIEAESHEAAAKAFANHPHLKIPESSIQIMPISALPGMENM